MKYTDILTAMVLLGDALAMELPAKVRAETCLMRAHYAKGIKEWETVREQIATDNPPKSGDERTDEENDALNELLTAKADEEAALERRHYSAEAFVELCGACPHDVVRRRGRKPEEDVLIPAAACLDAVTATLMEEA